jgi:hypothetical protein
MIFHLKLLVSVSVCSPEPGHAMDVLSLVNESQHVGKSKATAHATQT